MLKLSPAQRHKYLAFFAVLVLAELSSVVPAVRNRFYDIPSIFYCGLIMAWSLSIRRRVVRRRIRYMLTAGTVLMGLLFGLRMCRYSLLYGLPEVQELFWFAYYVPFCLIPLTAFFAAECVFRDDPERSLAFSKPLWAAGAVLSALFLTNGWHQLAFRFSDASHSDYSYGPLYADGR